MKLTGQWANSKQEIAGFLYVNKSTKEVDVFTCPNCGVDPTNGAAGQTDPEVLAGYEDYVNRNLGTIIGAWHTHPNNPRFTPFEQSEPSSNMGKGGDDYLGFSTYIKTISAEGIGIIVTKSLITIYPISINRQNYLATNDKDIPFVNSPIFKKGSTATQGWQHGKFDKSVTPKRKW
jgi:hypothetical protein